MLYALEYDIRKCRKTAKGWARRKSSITALFRDWESLQQSTVEFLEYCSQQLLYSSRFRAGIDSFNGKSYRVSKASDERQVVGSQDQLAFAVYSFRDHAVAVMRRIRNFLAFIAVRRREKRAFHWELDFTKGALIAIYEVVNAMELLQPFSMRHYEQTGLRKSTSASEAATFHPLAYYEHQVEITTFFEETWTAMKLNQSENPSDHIEENCEELWKCVFGQVETAWRKNGISDKVIAHLTQFRRVAKAARAPQRLGQAASGADTSMPDQLEVVSKAIESHHRQVDDAASEQLLRRRGYDAFIGLTAPSYGGRPMTIAAPRQLQFASIEGVRAAVEQLELRDRRPKPSMFSEGLSWEEQQQRRDAKMTSGGPQPAGDTTGSADEVAPLPEDDDATPQIEFRDARTYYEWRSIFPLAGASEAERGSGSMKWEELMALMQSPPLDFTFAAAKTNSRTFNRTAQHGWPGGSVTVHKPHGANPTLEKHSLDLIRKSMRRAFGWTADDFVLV